MARERTRHQDRGFTLVELLVVVAIIGMVTVIALPTVLPALSHRQVSEAGRILQGAIVGARDKAIHDGRPSGIRLLPDPAFNGINTATGAFDPTMPLAYNRIVPIGPAPEYSEGMATIRPTFVGYAARIRNPAGANAPVPTLVLEEAPRDAKNLPNPPTTWWWNVRVGDRVQPRATGPVYTVVGPIWQPNAEGFVNIGHPGTVSPITDAAGQRIEWLLLTNGRDDNQNGWIDEGWDGIDNDASGPGAGLIDDAGEWEPEAWIGADAAGAFSVPYVIRRRPLPITSARAISLPDKMVIDATTWASTRERSRLPVDALTGSVDLMVNPDGSVFYASRYGIPSSMDMGQAFYHFWLADRSDVVPIDTSATAAPYLPIGDITSTGNANDPKNHPYHGPRLKEGAAVLTVTARTGQLVVLDSPKFDNPAFPVSGTYAVPVGTTPPTIAYDPGYPFREGVQGVQ